MITFPEIFSLTGDFVVRPGIATGRSAERIEVRALIKCNREN
jgi:hypothetical protein